MLSDGDDSCKVPAACAPRLRMAQGFLEGY